jgi:hypothetical protein
MGGNLSEISETQWDFLPPDMPLIDFPQIAPIPMFIFYLWGVWSVFWLAGLILFAFRLFQGDTNIKMRSPTLVILSSFGAEMAFSCTAWDVALTRARYPCFLDFYYLLAFLPLYFLPFVLRFVRYLLTMRRLTQWEHEERKVALRADSEFWLCESSYVSILGVIMTIILAAGVSFQFTTLSNWVNAYGCELKKVTSIFLIVFIVVCVAFLVGSWFLMAKRSAIFPDRYHLKTELVSCFFIWFLALVPYVFLYMLWPSASDYLGLLMFVFIAAGYFSSVIWPVILSFRALPADVTNAEVLQSMNDILRDPEGMAIVQKVAQLHHGHEMCELAAAILDYQIRKDAELPARAQFIFDTFIKADSPRQANLPGGMVAEIKDRIESRQFTSDLFQRAYQEMCKLLQQNFLKEVKSTPEFEDLLKKKQQTQGEEVGRKLLEA